MGKKLDAFFRKSFNTSKFKSTVTNALARIAILKKQHQQRWSQARSDVVQLLILDHHESAILRVDHVIREQNLLDALAIIEGYCMLLMERIALIKSSIECPEELKEAVASVVYAASRYGQLSELQKTCRIFMKKYGKELIDRANELRNNCGVNPKVAEKLSARRRSLRTRLKVLKKIAAEHSITLQLEEENSEVTRDKIDARETTHLDGQTEPQTKELSAKKMKDESFYAYLKARNRYRDVKQAAQAAYKLASRAAAAAKVAVELSQTKSRDNGCDDSNHQEKDLAKHNEEASLKEVKQRQKEASLHEFDAFEASFRNFSIQMPNKSFRSESDEAGPNNTEADMQGAAFVFFSESDVDTNQQLVFKIPGQTKTMVMEVDSDGKDEENKTRQHKQPWDWDIEKKFIEKKFSSFTNDFLSFRNSDAGKDESNSSNHPTAHHYPSHYSEKGRITDSPSEGRRPA